MKLVMNMGYVYRLSDKAYRRVLAQITTDAEFDLDKEGTSLGYVISDLTDMGAEEARNELEFERARVKEKRVGR